MGNLVNLDILLLGNNELSGPIPCSLGNLYYYLGCGEDCEASGDLSYNGFTFDGMELVAQKLNKVYYAHQKNIVVHQIGNTLSVYAGGTLKNNTYKWFRCDGTTSTLVATIKGDSTFHPSESGRYRVKVINSVATQLQLYTKLYDYSSSNTIVASSESTLKQSDKPSLLRVYPNPVKDELHVQMKEGVVSLINQAGKALITKTIHVTGMINVTGLPSGLYYLKNTQTGEVKKVSISR